jgi:hypothetical protein
MMLFGDAESEIAGRQALHVKNSSAALSGAESRAETAASKFLKNLHLRKLRY